MRRNILHWLTGSFGTLLTLAISSTAVRGDYIPPAKSNNLVGDAFEFVGDFSPWSASMNNLPVEFLAMTPSANQGQTVFLLFFLWLMDSRNGATEKAFQGSPPGSSGFGALFPPPAAGHSAHSPTGSIVVGPSEQDPLSLHSNGGNGSSGIGGKGGTDSLSLAASGANGSLGSGENSGNGPTSSLLGGRDDPPGIGGNGGSGLLSSQSGSLSGGNSSRSLFSAMLPLGWAAHDSESSPLSPDTATPAPASFALLAVGGAGLLVGVWRRRRFGCKELPG